MDIAIVGLGYVGAVSAACLASSGHKVWGVDINPEKVDIMNKGRSPIVEPGLEELLQAAVASGNLVATTSMEEAIRNTDVCFVSVATPSSRAGQIDATHLLRACRQIAEQVVKAGKRQVICIRSSVLPSVFDAAQELFERTAPGAITLCANPEFLREGTAIYDYSHPPFTVIGTENAEAEAMLRSLYAHIDAPVFVLSAREATLVKYASNAFHALKVAFANEIGTVCAESGLDGEAVMKVFCEDTKLNISKRYMRPGFAFGGSCLPKDVRALLYAGKTLDIELPLLEGVLASNRWLIEHTVDEVLSRNARTVGMIGLSFKSNTDDLRESPFVELAERLIGKGVQMRIFDPNVSLAKLMGANKDYIENRLPHLSRLLVDSLGSTAEGVDLLIVGHKYEGTAELLAQAKCPVLDLTTRQRSILRGELAGAR